MSSLQDATRTAGYTGSIYTIPKPVDGGLHWRFDSMNKVGERPQPNLSDRTSSADLQNHYSKA